tara:strand:+ start:115 stop:993 length:879 start_codon:yes stop_codon:yes gene_type:complete
MKRLLALIREWFYTQVDPLEKLKIRNLRRAQQIVQIRSLIPYFEGTTTFAFATGGSLSNQSGLERVKDHNVLMLTTAPVQFFRLYGVMPNLWLIHNPESVTMAAQAIKDHGLQYSIDFRNTFVLVPDNNSAAKVRFSSKRMRALRKVIGETTYVLYDEQIYDSNQKIKIPEGYAEVGHEPIRSMNGSSVEASFVPFLGFLGIKTIFFGGVDHMDTGHFWDREDPWQNADGTPKTFTDSERVVESGHLAIEHIKEAGISVLRLEKEETMLKHYPYIEFEEALAKSSERVLPLQ